MTERVIENLNRALHLAMERDPDVYLIGEDLLDPYGGAFKASKGLSTKFPDRVLTTPISEAAIMGVANGLALCGYKPIAEVMFGDFICLAFDQIVNFAAKSPTMFGEDFPYSFLVRCPVGGNRGYGATHSQSLQKHFIGVPNLTLFELSPLHDAVAYLPRILDRRAPAILFEHKVLYGRAQLSAQEIDPAFEVRTIQGDDNYRIVTLRGSDAPEVLLLCGGGCVHDALTASKTLFEEYEIESAVVVPFQLFPFDANPLLSLIESASIVAVIEESTEGGTWGAEVSHRLWHDARRLLKRPVEIICSRDSVIPSAPHLERAVLVQTSDIISRIVEVIDDV